MSTLSQILSDVGELPEDASVFVSGCAAEIPDLSPALESLRGKGKITVSGIFLPGLNRGDYTVVSENMYCRTFFMTPQLASSASGRVEYCPWRYREIVRDYLSKPTDVAIVMLSPPDERGVCSYGVTSDFAPLILPNATVKIGVINAHMPRVAGASIPLSALDHCVHIDEPLLVSRDAKIDDTSRAIAQYIAPFVIDGATLQLGLGSIPGAVAGTLMNRRNLRVHSGLIDSSIFLLEEAGALDTNHPIFGGVALGSAEFLQSLHENPRLTLQSIDKTHDITAIANTPSFIAINGALEVDLLGQTNSFVLPSGFMSGQGGLPEFVTGALASPGGRSIIALNATAAKGKQSKIVSRLSGGIPSIPASDADVVVTEFGVAELRGKSLSQRVEAMISIADPRHRDLLRQEAGAVLN